MRTTKYIHQVSVCSCWSWDCTQVEPTTWYSRLFLPFNLLWFSPTTQNWQFRIKSGILKLLIEINGWISQRQGLVASGLVGLFFNPSPDLKTFWHGINCWLDSFLIKFYCDIRDWYCFTERIWFAIHVIFKRNHFYGKILEPSQNPV